MDTLVFVTFAVLVIAVVVLIAWLETARSQVKALGALQSHTANTLESAHLRLAAYERLTDEVRAHERRMGSADREYENRKAWCDSELAALYAERDRVLAPGVKIVVAS